jgi:energy-coupling factor transporter ATP-binding protein EcfA2
MKYSDLVQFEPIESVIQLEQANSADAVRQLVQTFVISQGMADQLCDIVIPNLQFETPADNKGVLIVGNYGTGKSHLMSLISGLAEHPEMAKIVKHDEVAKSAKRISGKFKVVRLELPSTKKSLRNIICGKLEDFMSQAGLSFTFPAEEQVDSNKDDLSNMMAQFNEKYPDHGLLLVVDELLDYLRSRDNQAIILDLGFLREMGEVCKLIRFRLIAGLQESLFDNPKFQFIAESLRRVKDRFEQARIVRQDVAFVVSERLLSKTNEQRAKIREHLQQFTPLYGGMAERLEEFVRLFPVHPTYLEVFEAISIAEKREVLKTLSAEIKRCYHTDVPTDQPGLVSYDSYWEFLQANAVQRSVPEIREVIDVSKVVEGQIQNAFTRPNLKPMALRIVHGLSVKRLATDDIRAKIGPTAEELQNGLCLFATIPEMTSDFLRTTVELCLTQIMRTMSGQFITHNTDNDQYYLDLQKTIDYDAKIDDKASTLSQSQLDQYYFDALTRVVVEDQSPYVRGYKIWQHEIVWREHKITRLGYLFFGAPNERSTAQPPRDFYLYFLQPFEPPQFVDQKLADEVFFKLAHRDKNFEDALAKYAGAREMGASASTGTKKVYEDKADGFLKTLVAWLRTNMLTSFEVVYQGVPKKLVEWLKGHKTGDAAVRDLLELTGSICLAASFEDRYPEYPKFTAELTTSNLKQPTEDVIRWLTGGVKNTLATAVLDGLELLDGEKLKPHLSRYAKVVLETLAAKPSGQVVNRKELITFKNDIERESRYQLEPEFLLIVLAALVQSGNITLSVAGNKFDAANLNDAVKTPLDQLLAFKHVEKPKGLPLAEWVALFEMFGLAEGLIRNENTHDEAIKQLRSKANELTERVVTVTQHVQNGLPCWGSELIPAEERDSPRQKLDGLKSFLEGLQAFNTPGKLRNFSKSLAEIQGQEPTLDLIKQIEDLNGLVLELTVLTSYLGTAAAVLPPQDPWRTQMETIRSDWRAKLMDSTTRNAADFRQKINRALQKAKDDYRTAYFNLHKKARLGVNEDTKKKELLKDSRLACLDKLAKGVSLLPQATLTELQGRLTKVKTCFTLVKDELDASPICPHCSFRPQEEGQGVGGGVVLGQIDNQLDTILESWTKTLLENVEDPTARQSISLLPAAQKKQVQAFLKDRNLPASLSNDLIQGLQETLSGLTAVNIKPSELVEALSDKGAPCTIDQIRERFDSFLQKLTQGKEVGKLRLVINTEGSGGLIREDGNE